MARDPYQYFRIEARELSEQLAKGVLDLEKGPVAALVAQLLRHAHTLKGAARVVRQREIADRVHQIETVLAQYRDSDLPVPRAQIDLLLHNVDEIGARVSALTPAPVASAREFQKATPDEPVAAFLRADVTEVDALLEGLTEAGVQLEVLRRGLASAERARRLSHQLAEQLAAPERATGDAPATFRLRALATELRSLCDASERNLTGGLAQMDRELRQAREGAERLRLLPARMLFNVLERTARDAAHSLGKDVAFGAKGGDIRLEADVLTAVQNALVQAVRNAIAHGLESAVERHAAGKSGEGHLWIEVERRADRIAFRCRDDGRGVSLEAVRRAAEQKGMLSANAPPLSQRDTLDLLLKGGLSTASTVTEIAGRGVGLDLIRDVANRLGGELHLESLAGAGMTLELLIPVSLSSIDALIVEAGGHKAAIPLDNVRRTLRVVPADLNHSAEGTVLVHEGKVIPFTTLERALRLPATKGRGPRAWSAVLVAHGKALAAVGVDALRGTENMVVRPLPQLTPVDRVVAGATLDASGNPRLVLAAEGLVSLARRTIPRAAQPAVVRDPVLVIDDSLTTRMLEQSILESAGYSVDVASSAEEALVMARRQRYCLFLVDVEMPGMDGFEFVASTRADAALREVPAILVTSRSSSEDKQRGKDAGASGYIVKNEFEQTGLLELIHGLVSVR
jgi:two-component system chemotaxis sensor kinase CheA